MRIGATLPVTGALGLRGIPTVLTGFGTPDSCIHAPDERLPVEHLGIGVRFVVRLLQLRAMVARNRRVARRAGDRRQPTESARMGGRSSRRRRDPRAGDDTPQLDSRHAQHRRCLGPSQSEGALTRARLLQNVGDLHRLSPECC